MIVESNTTVTVEFVDRMVKMTWGQRPAVKDIRRAFEEVVDYLEERVDPVYVIIDITSNPHFPIVSTVQAAMPAFRNEMLRAWLVIGSNSLAQVIEGILSGVTKRRNVHWFANEDEMLAFVAEHE